MAYWSLLDPWNSGRHRRFLVLHCATLVMLSRPVFQNPLMRKQAQTWSKQGWQPRNATNRPGTRKIDCPHEISPKKYVICNIYIILERWFKSPCQWDQWKHASRNVTWRAFRIRLVGFPRHASQNWSDMEYSMRFYIWVPKQACKDTSLGDVKFTPLYEKNVNAMTRWYWQSPWQVLPRLMDNSSASQSGLFLHVAMFLL